jgi:Fis family transcriptional regulator
MAIVFNLLKHTNRCFALKPSLSIIPTLLQYLDHTSMVECVISNKSDDTQDQQKPLRELIQIALERYFSHLDKNMPPKAVYQMVIEETEIPLFQATLAYTNGNQCQAAEILGISRSTLRKKIKHYHLTNI